MKSVKVETRALGGLTFKPDVIARIHIRPALNGTDKHVAVGFNLSQGGTRTKVVMFEPRIPALTICSNFNRGRKRKHGNSTCTPPAKIEAKKFVESLPNLRERECSKDSSAMSLEQTAVYHLSQEILHVFFAPYSSEPDERVEVFVHYRKICLSTSIWMDSIDSFVSQHCACLSCSGDQDQLLLDWTEDDEGLIEDLDDQDPDALDLNFCLEQFATS